MPHMARLRPTRPTSTALLERDWDSWHTGKQHLYTEEKFDRSANSETHWLSLENGYADHLESGNMRQPGGPTFRGVLPEMVGGRYSHLKQYSIPTTGCYEGGLEYFFDGYIAQKSLEAIQQRDKEKPFLLNAMFLAPHPPLEIPEPWYSGNATQRPSGKCRPLVAGPVAASALQSAGIPWRPLQSTGLAGNLARLRGPGLALG